MNTDRPGPKRKLPGNYEELSRICRVCFSNESWTFFVCTNKVTTISATKAIEVFKKHGTVKYIQLLGGGFDVLFLSLFVKDGTMEPIFNEHIFPIGLLKLTAGLATPLAKCIFLGWGGVGCDNICCTRTHG